MHDPWSGLYEEMVCSNEIDVSDSFGYLPFIKGWGRNQPVNDRFDIIDDQEIVEMIADIEDLPGMVHNKTFKTGAHLQFKEVDKELGEKLIAPIRGKCF